MMILVDVLQLQEAMDVDCMFFSIGLLMTYDSFLDWCHAMTQKLRVWLCYLVEAKSLQAHAIHNGVNVVGGQSACFAGQAQQRARPVLPPQKLHDTLWSKGHWSSTWHRWRHRHRHQHLFMIMMLSIGHALSRPIIHSNFRMGWLRRLDHIEGVWTSHDWSRSWPGWSCRSQWRLNSIQFDVFGKQVGGTRLNLKLTGLQWAGGMPISPVYVSLNAFYICILWHSSKMSQTMVFPANLDKNICFGKIW